MSYFFIIRRFPLFGTCGCRRPTGVAINPNQGSGVRVSKTNHSQSAGIFAVDFAVRPEMLPPPRPTARGTVPATYDKGMLCRLPMCRTDGAASLYRRKIVCTGKPWPSHAVAVANVASPPPRMAVVCPERTPAAPHYHAGASRVPVVLISLFSRAWRDPPDRQLPGGNMQWNAQSIAASHARYGLAGGGTDNIVSPPRQPQCF